MKNLYLPQQSKILKIEPQNRDTKIYTLSWPKNLSKYSPKLTFIPGQFLMLAVPGVGEAPFGFASSPKILSKFDICVKKVGLVTSALDQKKKGDFVGVRGPFGNGFPIKQLNNKDLVLVAGGFGIAPISALIDYLISQRRNYHQIYLLYGAKTPDEILFKTKFKIWEKKINLNLIVENPSKDWQKDSGLVTDLTPKLKIDPTNTISVMTGPKIMYRFMVKKLLKLGISEENIYLSLESRISCGIGKCQHCVIGNHYVCSEGPVFNYQEVKDEINKD